MDSSFEPMDIDKSASSTSKMDISFDDSGNNIVDLTMDHDESFAITRRFFKGPGGPVKLLKRSEIKKEKDTSSPKEKTERKQKLSIKTYHIKMQHTEKKSPPSNLRKIVYGLIVVFMVSLAYKFMKFKCAGGMDLRLLRKEFSENIFGQSAATNKIIETLRFQDKNKILFFYGGTGVGKTYAVSLMLNGMWDLANVYHFTMPTFADTFSPELMLGLTLCDTTILVVDDLTRTSNISLQIQSVVAKSEKLGKNLTIILVYNCDNITDNFVKKCDHQFHHELENHFKTVDVIKQFIKFEPLNEEHLKKCIERELGSRKVTWQEMNNIVKNFDVSLDGCKGVYTKIKFFNFI